MKELRRNPKPQGVVQLATKATLFWLSPSALMLLAGSACLLQPKPASYLKLCLFHLPSRHNSLYSFGSS